MIDGEVRLSVPNNKNNRAVGHSSESDFTISRPSLFFYTMKDAYYFPHDSNAQTDPKILQLRDKYGWQGYGIYFAIVEKLRNEPDYKIPSLAKASLNQCLSVDKGWLEAFFIDCLDIGLFVDDGKHFYSDSLIRRMHKIDEIRNKLRESGRKGGLARVAQAGLKQPLSMKVKESKVKESKKRERSLFVPPTLQDIKDYIQENKYNVNADEFYKFFTAGDWVDSKGQKVRNWKQKVITWNSHQKTPYEKTKPEGRKYEDFTNSATPQRPEVNAEGLAKIKALTTGLKEKMGAK